MSKRIKSFFRNTIRAISLASILALSSCTTSAPSQLGIQERIQGRKEFREILTSFEKGVVEKREWQGLKLRTVPKRKVYYFNDFIEPENSEVVKFNDKLRKAIPNFDQEPDFIKAYFIYENLRRNFKYEFNPFNKLTFAERAPIGMRMSFREFLKVSDKNFIGMQNVSETHRYRKSSCVGLALLYASHMRNAGIETYLVLADIIKKPDHMLIYFKPNKLMEGEAPSDKIYILDSSSSKLSFTENLRFSQNYLNPKYSRGCFSLVRENP